MSARREGVGSELQVPPGPGSFCQPNMVPSASSPSHSKGGGEEEEWEEEEEEEEEGEEDEIKALCQTFRQSTSDHNDATLGVKTDSCVCVQPTPELRSVGSVTTVSWFSAFAAVVQAVSFPRRGKFRKRKTAFRHPPAPAPAPAIPAQIWSPLFRSDADKLLENATQWHINAPVKWRFGDVIAERHRRRRMKTNDGMGHMHRFDAEA